MEKIITRMQNICNKMLTCQDMQLLQLTSKAPHLANKKAWQQQIQNRISVHPP